MADPSSRRKLAAILSADVVGYSRLMAANEAATVETLKSYRDIIARLVVRRGGRVVNAPGDALLAEFPSAVEAVQAAVEIQKSVEGHNIELEPERRMQFRIGVNLGDVIEEADGTIYGDGVNIAARMEALAEGGGVCISSTVYDAVEGKLSYGFDFLGEQQVKNISKPVRVYRVRAEPKPISQRSASGPSLPDKPSIAVLPFVNMSGDHAHDYLSDGITENIITGLSRFRDLVSYRQLLDVCLQGQGAENTGCGERARREIRARRQRPKIKHPGHDNGSADRRSHRRTPVGRAL